MSDFLKKAIELLSNSKATKKKQREKINETGGIPETGQATGDAETGKRKEEEETEMKLKDKGKLFVGGLSYATTTEGLKAYFSRFGSVVDAVVMTFPDTKRSRGYGFVTFTDPASAKVALAVESHVLDGKAVDIRLFESNRKKSKFKKRNESRLFLGGIPCDMKEENLKNFFSRYGKVASIIIPHSRATDKPKGYAFLSFEEKEAAEKCLSESFVHLGNKRVVIKKATARGGLTKTVSDVEDGVDYCGSDLESVAEYGDDVSSLPDDDCQSSASGDRTSLFEEFPGFLSVFQSYFQPLIDAKLADKMERREEDQKWQPSVRDTQEIEKLLASFLRESSRAGVDTFSDEDVTDDDDDFNDSEESVSDEEEDDSDNSVDEEDGDDDDHDNALFETGSAVAKLNAKLKEILIAKTAEAKIGNLKSSVHENELLTFQSSSLPFTIKDKAGSLRCSLCQWTPPDGSCETFLAHCNTAAHRMKTKGRFMSEDIQEGKAKNKTSNPPREIDPRMISFETGIRQGLSEEQNKIQTGQDSREQRKKKLPLADEQISQQQQQQQQQQKQKKKQQQYNQQTPQQPQPQQQKKKKTQQQPGQQTPQQVEQQKKTTKQQQPGQQTTQKSQQQLQKGNQNSENPSQSASIKNTKKIPNLKVQALAKGMVCIQPVAPNELSCRMCNKTIPKASNFDNLMRNVSCHLQSKGHLSKLDATESSLKKALNQNPGQGGKNTSGKNTTTEKKEQAAAPKGKNPGPGNNSEKTDKKIGKMAPAANVATRKVHFLCLICNYFASRQKTFNAHLNSDVHSETFKKTNSKPSNCDFVFCKYCSRYLFGSLYEISKHISVCSK